MLLLPNCKINFGLNVVNRRSDGYHDIETIFYPIPLHDSLEFNPLDDLDPAPYSFALSGKAISGNPADNLVVKVYLALKEEFSLPALDIFLRKDIPLGAGLGGGSSDAAAMMTGLNEAFHLGLDQNDMERRLSHFGADCPFFVRNRPAFATGIGDILTSSSLSLKGYYILLVKPNIFVSTREAYAQIRPAHPQMPLSEACLLPPDTWRDNIHNDFETSVFPQHPELSAIKQTLYDMGAVYAAMSGSGSTIYGLFDRPTPEAKTIFAQHFVYNEKLIR